MPSQSESLRIAWLVYRGNPYCGGQGVYTRYVARELTELGHQAWDGPKGEALKKLIPTGRFALPEEIAASAVFLGSQAADMINGMDLLVDGGYTIR